MQQLWKARPFSKGVFLNRQEAINEKRGEARQGSNTSGAIGR